MLWYRVWLETRSRFLIGLGLLIVVAAGTVMGYSTARELAPLARELDLSGPLAQAVKESLELQSSYRGYIWLRWFTDNLAQLGTLFAVMLGSGGIVSYASGRGTLFTLALPVTRNRLIGVRAACGLGQWMLVVFASSLIIPLASPTVAEAYGLVDTLVHAFSLFIVGTLFFCLALLLSTIFNDVWRPMLIALAVAVVLAACEFALRDALPFGLVRTMTAESYFLTGEIPWVGWLVSGALSGVMLYRAAIVFQRRDY